MATDFNALLALQSVGETTHDLPTALAEALALQQEEQKKQAAQEFLKLLQLMEKEKTHMRKTIKSLRRQMEHTLKELNQLDSMFEFGKTTNNWIPLIRELHSLPRDISLEDVTASLAEYEQFVKNKDQKKNKKKK